ncbi:MAG: carboxymuconolactone decarboxylase family protein [Betaproteobacteria bacterium]|nr:MAG: carboxymuconolactone decarboxylase family protein [Betaproteobacteria bacterium]
MTEIDGGEGKLADLEAWPESRAFSAPERVALEYAERMTYTGRKVDDALFARLKEHFSEPQIVELTAAIALENFRSKFNPALGVASQGFCLLPSGAQRQVKMPR